MNINEEIFTYKRMIDRAQREIADLEERYQGVRPSWVSGDIGMLHVSIERYKTLIHQLQQEAK